MNWFAWGTAVFLIFASAFGLGCGGGSGSSGFDLRALEDEAIATALREQRCVSLGGNASLICPLAVELPASPGSDVVVSAPSGVSLECARDGSACELRMTLEAAWTREGEVTTSVVAVRRAGQGEPWQVLAPGQALSPGQGVDVVLGLSGPMVRTPDRALEIEVAVLLFVGRPAPVLGTVQILNATGAQRIFVAKVIWAVVDRP